MRRFHFSEEVIPLISHQMRSQALALFFLNLQRPSFRTPLTSYIHISNQIIAA
jgi:hypothetical protein